MRSCLAGLLLHGPLCHFWYQGMDDFFDEIELNQWWSVFPKVAVDELVWTPFWNGCYLSFTGLLSGKTPEECVKVVKQTFLPLLKAGVNIWIPANLITYGLIPQESRLLWADMVEILWCVVLAKKADEIEH